MKKMEITEIKEPNLLEDIFPHEMPPHIVFDGSVTEQLNGKTYTINPADMQKRDIHITDTTFRDGQQARPPYTVQQTVDLFDLISKVGGPNGVIRQTEFFLYSKKDREAVEKCLELGHKFPEITGWVRAEPEDVHLAASVGLRETGMLTSCSDYHVFMKLKMDRRQALDKYVGLAKEAISKGVRPRCHLEDVTRADIYGFVIPYVQELMKVSEQVDDSLKVKIRLCDTMGFGVPYPGTILPRSVPKLVLAMLNDGGVPSDCLEWHGHNDFHKVMVNGICAWQYGCDALNGTLLGIGERTGNPPIEGALMEYIGIKRDMCGINTEAITEIGKYYRSIGTPIPARAPFMGDDFVKTRAGIHAGGLSADERIYNIFDSTKLLKRPPQVVLTDKSGTDGVYLWVNNYLGLKNKERVKKTKMIKVMKYVAEQYDVEERTTAISDEELAKLVKKHMPKYYEEAEKEGRLMFTA
ncbi:MAG: hypothetical protein JXD22_09175 [Sedimentisphaerales bacterium]|nr:hypothetical protein [Sedimentisphaerales bacterium]